MEWLPYLVALVVLCFAVAGLAGVVALRGRGRDNVGDIVAAVAKELGLQARDGGASGRVGRATVELCVAGRPRNPQLSVSASLPRPLGLGLSMRRRSSGNTLELVADGVELDSSPELSDWEIRAHKQREATELLGPRVRQALGALGAGDRTEVVVDDAGCRAISTGWRRDPAWLRQHVLAVVRVAGVLDSETAKFALADTMDVLSETHPAVDDV